MMNHLNYQVAYKDVLEPFTDWHCACLRFDEIARQNVAVELLAWSMQKGDYTPICTYNPNPYFVYRKSWKSLSNDLSRRLAERVI